MQKKSNEIQRTGTGAYRFGEFDLFPSERQLHRRQRPVRLPPKAFDALHLFVQNAERLVRREQLIETLWPDTFVSEANLTNVIVVLRKILGRDAIQTVSKFGYRFCMPVVGEPGIDHSTYATFLEARELATVRSHDSMRQARDLFSVCVAANPAFAAAWAWLGRTARFLDKFGGGGSADLQLAEASLRRALAIDPHLACAHHFYTQLQIDLGHSEDAIVRLASRIVERGEEPESYAGLVQAFRFCGLLDESIAASERATALDPTIITSVPHTHFLHCEYEATLETYAQTRYYLDAAAWAALGDTERATTLLQERLDRTQLSPLISGLMGSLLATLIGRRDEAIKIMKSMAVEREPEVTFYLARHFSLLGQPSEALRLLKQARCEGFTSSYALIHDKGFTSLRNDPQFSEELNEATHTARKAKRRLEATGVLERLAKTRRLSATGRAPVRQ